MSENIKNGPTGSGGYKYDSGKVLAGVLYEDFPNALLAVAEVGTFGAHKYVRNSWKHVPSADIRYKDALHRHLLEAARGNAFDEESKLMHYAHAAWNALAVLELEIKKMLLQQEKREAEKLQAYQELQTAATHGDPHLHNAKQYFDSTNGETP